MVGEDGRRKTKGNEVTVKNAPYWMEAAEIEEALKKVGVIQRDEVATFENNLDVRKGPYRCRVLFNEGVEIVEAPGEPLFVMMVEGEALEVHDRNAKKW